MNEREIFAAALGKSGPAERAAYLAEACRNQAGLREQVEVLLREHEQLGSFLESPAPAAHLLATTAEPVYERPGTIIGPYKLLEQIGEGGFGVVFMAEQTQPVRRKVALKILKPGMDTRQVVARFEAERQALAIMDHPNIAKVLDGGQTESCRPYFVMDLVKGLPITEYCDQAQLAPRERLELFVQVCQAVQHAHQKGVIHRDLKPSNVLVMVHDTTPVVKVIDFGVAKALGQELTDKTPFTGFAQMIGTPLYMSPEQAGQSGLDIDTRSDIYSLGVMLYELLTGTTPFEKDRLKELSYDELRRVIREEEPPKPSTRISTLGKAATTVSTQRKSDPKRLSQLCRGELDWVVMKCLEKDRNRRYDSANALAADIQHYLEDQPVLACPSSATYRLKKFLRRNRGPVAAVGVVLLGLLVGIAGAVVGLLRAQDEAEGARRASLAEATQNRRAQQNLSLALQVLDDIYLQVAQDRVPRDPRQEEKEHEMLRKALAFYREFAEQNSADPAVPLEVVRANRRVGDIERLVGQHAGAGKAYAAAIGKAEQLVKDFPGKAEYSYELAVGLNSLGELLAETGEIATADEQFRKAGGILRPLTNDSPKVHEYTAELARSHHGLGLTLKQRGERGEAEKEFRQAIDLQSKMAATFAGAPRYRAELAQMHRSAGRWNRIPGDDRAANEHLRSAVKLLRELVRDFPATPLYRHQLAAALGELTTQESQENSWEDVIALLQQLAGDFPTVPDYRCDLAAAYNNQAQQQVAATGDFAPVAGLYGKSFELSRKLAADFPRVTRYQASFASANLNRAGNAIEHEKDFAKARKFLEQAIAGFQRLSTAYPHNQLYATCIIDCTDTLAGVLAALGRPADAAKKRQETEQTFRHTLAAFEKLRDEKSLAFTYCLQMASISVSNGTMWMKLGRTEQATAAYRFAIKSYVKAFELHPKSVGEATDFWRLGWGFQGEPRRAAVRNAAEIVAKLLEEIPDGPARKRIRADLLAARIGTINTPSPGKAEDAKKLYREAAGLLQQLAADCSDTPEDRDTLARGHYNLAEFLRNSARFPEAEKAYRRAMLIWAKLATERQRDYQQHLAYAHWNLAAVLEAQKQTRQVEETYRLAIEHWQKLVNGFPNNWYRHELAFSHGLLGNFLRIAKRPGEAEKAYARALALEKEIVAAEPSHADYRLRLAAWHDRLAELFTDLGRLPQAEQERRQALTLVEKLASDFAAEPHYRSDLASRYHQLAELLKQAKQPDEAEKVYRDAIAVWAKLVEDFNREGDRNSLAYNSDLLGHLLNTTDKFSQAAQAFRKAMAVWQKLHTDFGKDDHRRYSSLSQAWLFETLAARARQIEKDVTLPDGERRDKAQAYRTEAKELVQDGLKRGLQAPTSLNSIAWVLATRANPVNRDPVFAIELAKLAVEREPKQGLYWTTVGVAQYRAGDWKAAVHTLNKAMELRNGGDSFGWFFLAMANWQLGERDKARQWFDRAVERMWLNEELWRFRAEAAALMGIGDPLPPFVEVQKRIDQAHALAGQGQWQRAAAEYARAGDALPGNAEIWLEYASVLLLADQQKGYREASADLLRRWPAVADPQTCYLLARTAALASGGGDPAQAVRWAEKGVAAHGKQAWYRHTLGVAHYRAGQFDQAIRWAQQSLKDDPAWGGHVVDWLLLAMAHQRLGHADEARQWLDKAVQWTDHVGKGLLKETRFVLPVPSWSDRLEIQLLRREAGALIEGQEKKNKSPTHSAP